MKKLLLLLLALLVLKLTVENKDEIINYIMINFIDKDISFKEPNQYYKEYDYNLVQNTDNLYPKNKQDILNIIYTTLNTGSDEVIFYCTYEKCIDDVNDVTDNREILSTINNLVHPFNSYKNIYFTINDYGKIKIRVKKTYEEKEIILINNKINEMLNNININKSEYDVIKEVHDYIVNNTKYDESVDLEKQQEEQTNSNKATGVFFDNLAICSGYSDAMAIILNRLGYNNYKISSSEHIWNLVYIDGSWKHLDATWDDPVAKDGKNILIHDFFLIDTKTLNEKDNDLEKNNHNFNKSLYKEAN